MPSTRPPLSIVATRRARAATYFNGLLWALGNGLVNSWLVIYTALELQAPRIALGVAFLRAAPHLVGVLRLAAPAVIDRFAARKPFCLGCYLASAAVLLCLPAAAVPGLIRSPNAALVILVGLWCSYHLLEYLGSVALWSWMADLVPTRIRGRFLGRRERWMVAGQAVGYLACGLFSFYWRKTFPDWAWLGYSLPATVGALLLLVAVTPLLRVPPLPTTRAAVIPLRQLLAAPLVDRRFLRLLLFGCWFSFFNGIALPVQDIYPRQVLKIELLVTLGLATTMRFGQMGLSPTLGRLADRWGNRPVIGGSLLIVAAGPLFYFRATPEQWWWIVGAWTCWVAFAGINVALPNLMLKLSPPDARAACIAAYHAITGLCLAGATLLGGQLADTFRGSTWAVLPGLPPLDHFHLAFLGAWFLRSLGVVVLLAVPEGRQMATSVGQTPLV